MSLDNSSCNLASLNLLKFLREDDTFDAETFVKAVELIITAMDISICFADFPTEAIGRPRATTASWASATPTSARCSWRPATATTPTVAARSRPAITSLMTGAAYKRSAELAAVVGPYKPATPATPRPTSGHAQAPGGQRQWCAPTT
jgi:ribonucleoside-diphosphate reductase alpha chain